MKRYVLLCAVSGMGWAVIAYFIAGRLGGAALWGGLVTAPLIGVIAGWVYRTGPSLALAWQAGDVTGPFRPPAEYKALQRGCPRQ